MPPRPQCLRRNRHDEMVNHEGWDENAPLPPHPPPLPPPPPLVPEAAQLLG